MLLSVAGGNLTPVMMKRDILYYIYLSVIV